MEAETFCQCSEQIHPLASGDWANAGGQLCCQAADHRPEREPVIIDHSATDPHYIPDGRYVAAFKYDSRLERCLNCGIQIGLVDGHWSNSLAGDVCQYHHHVPVESKISL